MEMSGERRRLVVVTGACGSVGGAVADKMAPWADLILTDIRDPGGGRGQGVFIQGDLGSADTLSALREAVQSAGQGLLDGVVNCVGVLNDADGDVVTCETDAWLSTFRTNVEAVWSVCRSMLPFLLASGEGSIVNIGSLVALRGSAASQLAYTASKGAVAAMTREIAVSMAPRIRANVVSPGVLDSGLMEKVLGNEAAVERRCARIPLGRLGKASEVANAVEWLLSPASSYVTGIELPVDGGASAGFLT